MTAEARLKGETLPEKTLIPSVLATKENAKEFYYPLTHRSDRAGRRWLELGANGHSINSPMSIIGQNRNFCAKRKRLSTINSPMSVIGVKSTDLTDELVNDEPYSAQR